MMDMMKRSYKRCKNNFGIHHGDCLDGIKPKDPRFSMAEVDLKHHTPLDQTALAYGIYKRMGKRLLTILSGWHDLALGEDGAFIKYLCEGTPPNEKGEKLIEGLGIPYGTGSCKIIYRDLKGRLLFKTYHTHGRKQINSVADDPIRIKSNLSLILKRHLAYQMGDCILMAKGHTHKLLVHEPQPRLYLTDDSEAIKQKYTGIEAVDQTASWIHPDDRFYVNTGSFMKLHGDGFSGYAERAEYAPVELGFAIARVRGGIMVGVDKIVL